MPRANRHYIAGHVWHITHRCHRREFLLKFGKDRRRWLYWLFEAKKRHGLRILNYTVTSNHIHLLVIDNGDRSVIPKSIQLIAGRIGQEFNQRKGRKGAYWEDRYHATAIDTDIYLAQCLIYVDLNMVRAGVVDHPSEWPYCGYNEIMKPKKRYALIDYEGLKEKLGFKKMDELSNVYREWIDESIKMKSQSRESKWTASIAVGSEAFVNVTREKLGLKVKGRNIVENDGSYELREPYASYNGLLDHENAVLGPENEYPWNVFDSISI